MMSERIMVGSVIHPMTNPKVRQHVFCKAQGCKWHGTIFDTIIVQHSPRRTGHVFISCPACGGELTDLSTNEPRRWI